MTPRDIAHHRLVNQQIGYPKYETPGELVALLGPLQRIENEDELVNGAIGRTLRPAQGPVSYYIMLRQTLRRILVRHQGINPFPAQTAKDRGEFPPPAGNSDRRPNPTQPFEIDTDHPTSPGSFDFPAVRIIEAKTNISDRSVCLNDGQFFAGKRIATTGYER